MPYSVPRLKGFSVPEEVQRERIELPAPLIENYYPSWYSQRTRQTLSAYALYVRDLMGDSDPDKALKLLNDAGLENLDLEAVGWIWQVVEDTPYASAELDAIRRHVNNRAVETAGAANFTSSYDDQTYLLLSSDRRTDAILLEALITDDSRKRPDPQGGQRAAGPPHCRAVGQHPGECLCPAGAGQVFQHL